ncbi:MAG: hypothetical protein ACK6A4_04910 [Alphaproteobacteria bacterium]
MTDTRTWWQRLIGVQRQPKARPPSKERIAEIDALLEKNPLMNALMGETIFMSLIVKGDEQRGSGDVTGALETFADAVKYAITQGQGQSPEWVTIWLNRRATAASRMGSCLLMMKDAAGARKIFETCLALFKVCAAGDPKNPQAIWDVFIAHKNIVTTLEVLNLPDEAAEHYEALVNAWHESTRVPPDAPVHMLSIVSGLRLAEIRKEQGDVGGVRAALTSTRFGMIDCGGTFPEIAWIFIGSPDSPRHQALLATGDPDSPEWALVDLAVRHAKAERELDAPH